MDRKFISRGFGFVYLLLLVSSPHLDAQEHQVAITIGDLPRSGDAPGSGAGNRALTSKLLAAFTQDHIAVTGFVNECQHAEEARDLLKLWTAAGADLGNHTCSHPDLNSTSVADFEADIVKGEPITSEVLGHLPAYFRYPYLHTGATAQAREQVEAFVRKRGYVLAPVTIDTADYVFAKVYAAKLAAGDAQEAARVRSAFLTYMEADCRFFEKWGVSVTGHDVKQILLLHANQLNADSMPQLLVQLRRRGYEFISLWEALTDPAYTLPDSYIGTNGISALHRWAMTRGMEVQHEPEPPVWVTKAYQLLIKQ